LKEPESECKDGDDTSIDVPGDNVGTDVISPPKGASDDESDEPPVLSSKAPLSGKALQFHQFLEAKKQQEEQKKKKRKKAKKKRKEKEEIKEKP
jgi:hypothetical protein